MSIHTRIKERRLALGLNSHKALADLIDVSWQTVQLWEKEGGTAPNRNRIERVAEVLQVSLEWLTTGRDGSSTDHLKPLRPGNNSDNKDTLSILTPEVNEKLGATYETRAQRMALHYITPDEEKLLELYRLSLEDGQEKIMFAAETTQKRSLAGITGNQPQSGKH